MDVPTPAIDGPGRYRLVYRVTVSCPPRELAVNESNSALEGAAGGVARVLDGEVMSVTAARLPHRPADLRHLVEVVVLVAFAPKSDLTGGDEKAWTFMREFQLHDAAEHIAAAVGGTLQSTSVLRVEPISPATV
jgi:hypothetical protein